MEKVIVLYNPLSNNNKGLEGAEALRATAYDKDLAYIDITTLTNYEEFFSKLAGDEKIIICGGDGTLNKFVNNVLNIDVKNELYYMPTGTGNDFYKEVSDGSSTPVRINNYIKNLPLCEIKGTKYAFLNGVGYGIDGYCCEVGDQLREKNAGKINYTSIAIKGLLFHYKTTNATVKVDGVEHNFKKVWLAPIMKGSYYGGGMNPCPNQDRNNKDGKISVLIFHGSSKLKTLMIFPSLFKGEHVKHSKYVTVLEGHDISVVYDSPRTAQVDGETIKNVSHINAKSIWN